MTTDEVQPTVASELEQKIITQIEYYFGDINLRRDKFLKEEAKKDDGWIPLATLLTFNRLKQLSPDAAVIIAALKKSDSGILEISDDNSKLRRSTEKPVVELTAEQKIDLDKRTVHFKGFPLDATLEKIREFSIQYGKVDAIEMRRARNPEKTFKGCCMVTYSTLDEAKKALEGTEQPCTELTFMREDKVRYWERKDIYHKSRKEKKALNGGKSEPSTPKKSEKKDGDEAAVKSEDGGQGDENDENKTEDEKKEPEAPIDPEVLARTVHLKGFNTSSTEEAVRTFAETYGKIDELEMIKRKDGEAFRGDIFVTYSTLEEAEKAVAGTEKPDNSQVRFWRETKSAYMAFDAGHRERNGATVAGRGGKRKSGDWQGGGSQNKKRRGGQGPFSRGGKHKGYKGKGRGDRRDRD